MPNCPVCGATGPAPCPACAALLARLARAQRAGFYRLPRAGQEADLARVFGGDVAGALGDLLDALLTTQHSKRGIPTTMEGCNSESRGTGPGAGGGRP